jgi:antitoxin VapB
MIVSPRFTFERVDNHEADLALTLWGHKMGMCNRPIGLVQSHGAFLDGELCAVTVTADLVRETCAGFNRAQAIELARLCADRPHLCRPVLRLWREFIFPCYGKSWAVSYQDKKLHNGDTYRFDGWVKLGASRSGNDTRGEGRKGRSKIIWGWNADKRMRDIRRTVDDL